MVQIINFMLTRGNLRKTLQVRACKFIGRLATACLWSSFSRKLTTPTLWHNANASLLLLK